MSFQPDIEDQQEKKNKNNNTFHTDEKEVRRRHVCLKKMGDQRVSQNENQFVFANHVVHFCLFVCLLGRFPCWLPFRTLTVSTGIKKIRKSAAATLAEIVLTPTLRSRVLSMLFIKVNIPVLAAVSPNRDNGPWINAGNKPR